MAGQSHSSIKSNLPHKTTGTSSGNGILKKVAFLLIDLTYFIFLCMTAWEWRLLRSFLFYFENFLYKMLVCHLCSGLLHRAASPLMWRCGRFALGRQEISEKWQELSSWRATLRVFMRLPFLMTLTGMISNYFTGFECRVRLLLDLLSCV